MYASSACWGRQNYWGQENNSDECGHGSPRCVERGCYRYECYDDSTKSISISITNRTLGFLAVLSSSVSRNQKKVGSAVSFLKFPKELFPRIKTLVKTIRKILSH